MQVQWHHTVSVVYEDDLVPRLHVASVVRLMNELLEAGAAEPRTLILYNAERPSVHQAVLPVRVCVRWSPSCAIPLRGWFVCLSARRQLVSGMDSTR